MVKVSIIIPVYNAENYIEKCLNSIMSQTLTDIEVIAINDGSKDKSKEVLEGFALKDYRIKVFSQSNKGASSARNLGIKKASGEYIGFVDIDDYIEEDMYFNLYSKALERKFDIVCCGFEEKNTDKESVLFYEPLLGKIELFGKDIKEYYLEKIIEDKFLGYLPLWNKIFKKDFIEKINLRIDETMVLGEDRVFCCEALMQANSIAAINEILYRYTKININSVTNKHDIKKVNMYIRDRNSILNFVNENIILKDKKLKYEKIHNERVFHKLIDFCIKEILSDNKIKIKYLNVESILTLKVMNEILKDNINTSHNMKMLIKLLEKKQYKLCYIMLFVRTKLA